MDLCQISPATNAKSACPATFCTHRWPIFDAKNKKVHAVWWKRFVIRISTHFVQKCSLFGRKALNELFETFKSRARPGDGNAVFAKPRLFWGISRKTKEVPDRTAATVMDTIKAPIAPGSLIISDKGASYQGNETMTDMNYTHEMVNHTEKAMDPTTGADTQTIESLWQVYKRQNKCQCSAHRSLVNSYMCEKKTPAWCLVCQYRLFYNSLVVVSLEYLFMIIYPTWTHPIQNNVTWSCATGQNSDPSVPRQPPRLHSTSVRLIFLLKSYLALPCFSS